MKRNTIAFTVVLILCVTVSGRGQNAGHAFSEAKGLPDLIAPTHFEFSVLGSGYSISYDGKGSMRIGNKNSRAFDLHLSPDGHLVRIYHAEYERDLLLLCEMSDGENGWGFLSRLDLQTLKLKWKRSIAGFSLGQGLVHQGYAYVTAIGFIGKINLESGTYVWKHGDLYERYNKAFNSFQLPEIRGNSVVFRERPDNLRKKVAVIIVDRATGKILKVNS